MKKKRFSDQQIIEFLKEAEAGMPVKELCRKDGFSDAAFYGWRSEFGGLQVNKTTTSTNVNSGGTVSMPTVHSRLRFNCWTLWVYCGWPGVRSSSARAGTRRRHLSSPVRSDAAGWRRVVVLFQ